MRMLFYWLICRNIQRVITLKTCFSECARQTALNKCLFCDWGYVICSALAGRRAVWVGERERRRHREAERVPKHQWDWQPYPPPLPKSPVTLWLLSALFTLGCEDCLIMAGLSAPAPFQAIWELPSLCWVFGQERYQWDVWFKTKWRLWSGIASSKLTANGQAGAFWKWTKKLYFFI